MGFREGIIRVEPFTISTITGAGLATSERPINGEILAIRYKANALIGSLFALTSGAAINSVDENEKLLYVNTVSGSLVQTFNPRTPAQLAISGAAITDSYVPIMLDNKYLQIAISGISPAAAKTVQVDVLYR